MDIQAVCSPDWLDIARAPIFKKLSHAMEISVFK